MTWRERIVAARARGKFSDDEVCDSAKWTSCAVGEQRAIHPDIVLFVQDANCTDPLHLVPNDLELIRLGTYKGMPHMPHCAQPSFHGFAWAIAYNLFDEAERFLDAIEDRVLELKREMGEHVEPWPHRDTSGWE